MAIPYSEEYKGKLINQNVIIDKSKLPECILEIVKRMKEYNKVIGSNKKYA